MLGFASPVLLPSPIDSFTQWIIADESGYCSRRLDGDGELALTLRLAPNPSARDAAGTVVGNFRLRDEGARPNEGARARGGSVSVDLTLPDATTRAVRLTWDDARGAYLARDVALQSGAYRLVVAPQALRDGAGNGNRAELALDLVVR